MGADPMYTIVPFIMAKRNDAMNMITLDIPLDPMQKYLNRIRKEGKNMSHLALVIGAYLRTAAELPSLNRFIVNRRIYARNEFAVGMVVQRPADMDGTMSKIYFDMTDDIFTVQEKIERYVEENRKSDDVNPTDKIMRTLVKLPVLIGFLVGVLKFMDHFGWLPKKLIDASPFHISLGISNLASIRTNHIYHHAYNFGTTSVFITIGNLREVPKRENGEITFFRSMPLGVVTDERICSGAYYARAFSRIKAYLADPTLMEGPPKVVNLEM